MSVYQSLTLCGTVGLLLILGSGNNSAQQPPLQKPTPLPEDIEKNNLFLAQTEVKHAKADTLARGH